MHADKNALSLKNLTDNLQDADQLVRIHAATVLGSLREQAESAVPILIHLLENGNVQDRRLAALTLGEIGSPNAISALCDAADDADEAVAEMAEWALEQIDEEEETEAA